MDLLNDTRLVINSFVDLIQQERDRIVSEKLLSAKECDSFINKQANATLKLSSGQEVAKHLSKVHSKLSQVKLAGDVLEIELIPLDLKEVEEADEQEQCGCKIDNNCECGPDCKCEKCTKLNSKEDKDKEKDSDNDKDEEKEKLLDENKKAFVEAICEELTTLASELGNKGQYELAYSIERTADEIKETDIEDIWNGILSKTK